MITDGRPAISHIGSILSDDHQIDGALPLGFLKLFEPLDLPASEVVTERDVDPENAILTGDDEIDFALSPAVITFRPGPARACNRYGLVQKSTIII